MRTRSGGPVARVLTKTFSARTATKRRIHPLPGRYQGRCGVVGDEPRGAGGGGAESRLSPAGGIVLRYSLSSSRRAGRPGISGQPALGAHAVRELAQERLEALPAAREPIIHGGG